MQSTSIALFSMHSQFWRNEGVTLYFVLLKIRTICFVIAGPSECSMTVAYLKDILNHTKLYIRSLQKDITDEDIKLFIAPKVTLYVFHFVIKQHLCV